MCVVILRFYRGCSIKNNPYYTKPRWSSCWKDEEYSSSRCGSRSRHGHWYRKRDACIDMRCESYSKSGHYKLHYRPGNSFKDCGGWMFRGWCN